MVITVYCNSKTFYLSENSNIPNVGDVLFFGSEYKYVVKEVQRYYVQPIKNGQCIEEGIDIFCEVK